MFPRRCVCEKKFRAWDSVQKKKGNVYYLRYLSAVILSRIDIEGQFSVSYVSVVLLICPAHFFRSQQRKTNFAHHLHKIEECVTCVTVLPLCLAQLYKVVLKLDILSESD